MTALPRPLDESAGDSTDADAEPGLLAALVASPFSTAAALLGAVALVLPLGVTLDGLTVRWTSFGPPFVFASCGLFAALFVLLRPPTSAVGALAFALAALTTAAAPLVVLASRLPTVLDARGWGSGFWCLIAALGCLAVGSLRRIAALGAWAAEARRPQRARKRSIAAIPPAPIATAIGLSASPRCTRFSHVPARRLLPPRLLGDAPVARLDARSPLAGRAAQTAPLLFGAWVLIFWQILTRALDVPQVLLPAPSAIGHALVVGGAVLAGDFVQTVLHSVVIGLAIGAGAGFMTGIAIDRSPFLRRGLLPLAALASTVPLVGVAPIMVMWFGFDWQSKAAVVALMTFFPMLVNTLAGLATSGRIERDLMRSYGAGYWRTLVALRLPVALPFVFAALKIDSTLALIGAIVAEFFGSPTAGLGFRISTEAARLNMGLVWAAIGVASLAGSLLYALIGWVERRATFWHPSIRSSRP